MASYSPHSETEDTQAYSNLRAEMDQTLDTTENDCDFCGLRYGGFDMLMHVHFVHNLSYSAVCPCDECLVVRLTKRDELAYLEALLFPTRAQAGHDDNAAPALADGHSLASGGLNPATEMNAQIEHRRKTSLAALHQRYPSSSSTASPPQPAFTEPAAENNFAFVDLTPDSRVDSLSSTQTPSVPMVHSTPTMQPVQSAQSVLPAPFTEPAAEDNFAFVDLTPDSRVDSFSLTQMPPMPMAHSTPTIQPAESVQSTPSVPFTPAQPILPMKGDPQLLPNNIRFFAPSSEISERNLPYNMSQIESGDLYEDDGRIVWIEKQLGPTPDWLDGDDQKVLSHITKLPMKWFDFLPYNILRDVSPWQLVYWFREAAAQGLHIRHQDLYDRMDSPLTSSGLTGRVQGWQRSVGMLSKTKSMNFNWPSKHALDTVAGLTYIQARFNTWWDVQFIRREGVFIARQPNDHAGYRQPMANARDKKNKTPYYIIDNPEYRQISEHVRLIDDAMLFLTIKAEECGMTKGYQELLPWFGLKAEDKWTRELDTDLALEFERWRYGCNDTPSISVLRLALEQAGSQAEAEAIKNADYSLTPWLQDVEVALTPLRKARSMRDQEARDKFAKKLANRKNDKRKTNQVDDVEMGAGGGKRRTS
jgi:hypothetical protein